MHSGMILIPCSFYCSAVAAAFLGSFLDFKKWSVALDVTHQLKFIVHVRVMHVCV